MAPSPESVPRFGAAQAGGRRAVLHQGAITLLEGDCVELMATMEPESIDAIVCDPPYGLEFMGEEWDRLDAGDSRQPWRGEMDPNAAHPAGRSLVRHGVGDSYGGDRAVQGRSMQEWHRRWAEQAFRLLKPGGHLLAFGGTRTYHRMVCGIEDAGFEVRDSIQWLYATGFPKSLNVASAIDERASRPGGDDASGAPALDEEAGTAGDAQAAWNPAQDYEAKTEQAKPWEGWGTALKPAHEPIVVARKPLVGTVAANVLGYGTGAINIDGCRIGTNGEQIKVPQSDPTNRQGTVGRDLGISRADPDRFQAAQRASIEKTNALGRWPANVVLSHAPGCKQVGTRTDTFGGGARASSGFVSGYEHDGFAGHDVEVPVWDCVPGCPVGEIDRQSGVSVSRRGRPRRGKAGDGWGMASTSAEYDDVGGASRFFYVAKADRAQRNAGLPRGQRNGHPTVKPLALMRHLVRLVTPPGGVVLDPFAGSGTTLLAALEEGLEAVGMERWAPFFDLACLRVKNHAVQQTLCT